MRITEVFDSTTKSAPAGYFTAVNAAVEFWERELINPISLSITFSYTALPQGALGQSNDAFSPVSYSQLRSALIAAGTSADDKSANAHLPSTFPSATAQFWLPYSEGLVLGLASGPPPTQNVYLTNTESFTFDPLHRAVGGLFDAVGVFEHEISEVLGRTAFSGDTTFDPPNPSFSPMDLFRFTTAGQLQLSPGAAYFSVNGGTTHLLPFNNPMNGDAADWDSSVSGDSFGVGMPGIASIVSPTDLRVMDVLGFTLAPDPFAPHDYNGDGQTQLLIENTGGQLEVGQVTAAKQFGYTYETTISSQWKVVATGDYLGEGHDQFLIENSSGMIDVSDINSGAVSFTYKTTIASTWSFRGSGDYLGNAAADQFLIENPSGVIDLGQLSSGKVSFTDVTTIATTWKFVGTGDFLDKGDTQFLIENSNGTLDIAQFTSGKIGFTYETVVSTQWSFVGAGDYENKGDDQFLIENASGVIDVGQFSGGKVGFTYLTTIATTWKFIGSGDYLAENHDQFLIENPSGEVLIGDIAGGALHFAKVSDLASQWTVHG